MALDGVSLHLVKKELENRLLDAKVDKIHQPSREELIFVMRGREGAYRLLVSAKANCPRIHITSKSFENPAQPPMLCMLLRKKLTGARLRAVRQLGLDRVLMLDFEGLNELGDMRTLTLTVEIMGRCSNAVLTEESGRIVDALKRVDGAMSSMRMILPGLSYSLPPMQDKLNILTESTECIIERIRQHSAEPLDKAILASVQGLSPIVCRELAWRACGQTDAIADRMPESVWYNLTEQIDTLRYVLEKGCGKPTMAVDANGRPVDIAMMDIMQYGEGVSVRRFESFGELLDSFYYEKDNAEHIRVNANDLLRVLSSASDRIARKLTLQRKELEQARDREQLRLYGDLVNANIYRLEKGQCFAELENYYSEEMETVRIALDPMLTPAQNAQAYYREYRKAQTAEEHLVPLIEQGEAELSYLDEVFDALSRARTNGDVAEIRAELTDEGYIRRQKQNGKKQNSTLPPLKFMSDDGFEIIVGRNNRQNDKLSLKQAAKTDIWLHACKMPGAHVIICAQGETVPNSTIEQAAIIAACFSKGREAGTVPIDFTFAKHVYKLPGAKPGMVNYTNQQTVYVKPDRELADRLKQP